MTPCHTRKCVQTITRDYGRPHAIHNGMRTLLTIENAKTIKGEKLGWLTGILYLAPANESGVMNTCQFATDGCKRSCLFTAGRASFTPSIITARIRKTRELHEDRESFMNTLRADIARLIRKAEKQGLKPAVRLNGTSDLPWMPLALAAEFPTVQFYDYTKLPHAWTRTRANYHLTFSHSESNDAECMRALQHGMNVAVVFDVKRGHALPDMWRGFHVIDGDTHTTCAF